MTEPDMIERVAQQILKNGVGELLWDVTSEERREIARRQARAAIEAMREPTPAVLSALQDQLALWVREMGLDEDVWFATIDAALSPPHPVRDTSKEESPHGR